MITAAEKKIDKLYHYQGYKIDYLTPIVLENLIYLPNPAGFNDPWDCRPSFKSNFDSPTAHEETIQYFLNAHRRQYGDRSDERSKRINRLIEDFRENPNKLSEYIKKFSSGIASDIDTNYRVYCLTTKNDWPLMWAHYTGRHSGVCLEFNARNALFGSAIKIEYNELYPQFSLTDNSTETNVKILTSKSKDWAYEDEYRLIGVDDIPKFRNTGLTIVKNNLLSFEETYLESIIVGCLMPQKDIEEIKELIKKSGKNIKLKQAKRSLTHYTLYIEDIS